MAQIVRYPREKQNSSLVNEDQPQLELISRKDTEIDDGLLTPRINPKSVSFDMVPPKKTFWEKMKGLVLMLIGVILLSINLICIKKVQRLNKNITTVELLISRGII